jgi:hypothetical protein
VGKLYFPSPIHFYGMDLNTKQGKHGAGIMVNLMVKNTTQYCDICQALFCIRNHTTAVVE